MIAFIGRIASWGLACRVLLATGALCSGIASAQITGKVLVGSSTNGNQAKTDFHVDLEGDKGLLVLRDAVFANGQAASTQIVINNGKGVAPNRITAADEAKKWTIEWDINIPANAKVDFNVVANQIVGTKVTDKARFTPANSPTDIPTLDWLVSDSGVVFLLNAYEEPVHFENLLFKIVSEGAMSVDVVREFMELGSGGGPGLLTSGDVPAASASGDPGELEVGQFTLNHPEYLLGRFDARFVNAAFSALTVRMGLAEDGQLFRVVDEPPILLLLAMAAALLVVRAPRPSPVR